MIFIEKFDEKYRQSLFDFVLSDQQLNYTSVPKEILDYAIENINSIPFVVINKNQEVVGFFVLEKHYQYPGFLTETDGIFIRSLSINEKYQGKGFGKELILSLPNLVKEYSNNIRNLYLVVDYDNTVALNLYEDAGFFHIASIELGGIGEERLYYINLDHIFINYMTLLLSKSVSSEVTISISYRNKVEIGYIYGFILGNTFIIENIEIEKSERNKHMAINALRKLPSLLRKYSSELESIEFKISKHFLQSKLPSHSNFVKVNESKDYTNYLKYIR